MCDGLGIFIIIALVTTIVIIIMRKFIIKGFNDYENI